ncbi:hypothetical protein C8Q80DRAFT_671903 [Daedaleopsis nitida]|nr:hypothetical protein C8Q80DRAFT_671903 [Daedaleopsis nitida]
MRWRAVEDESLSGRTGGTWRSEWRVQPVCVCALVHDRRESEPVHLGVAAGLADTGNGLRSSHQASGSTPTSRTTLLPRLKTRSSSFRRSIASGACSGRVWPCCRYTETFDPGPSGCCKSATRIPPTDTLGRTPSRRMQGDYLCAAAWQPGHVGDSRISSECSSVNLVAGESAVIACVVLSSPFVLWCRHREVVDWTRTAAWTAGVEGAIVVYSESEGPGLPRNVSELPA